MKVNEVRIINANQEKRKVYFHLNNGKTVVRTMEAREIIAANKLRRTEGEAARIAEYVRLFNEKYSEPQKVSNAALSASEKRYFELHNISNIIPLTDEEDEELKELEDMDVL